MRAHRKIRLLLILRDCTAWVYYTPLSNRSTVSTTHVYSLGGVTKNSVIENSIIRCLITNGSQLMLATVILRRQEQSRATIMILAIVADEVRVFECGHHNLAHLY